MSGLAATEPTDAPRPLLGSANGRWVVVAASGRQAARAFALEQGISPSEVLTKDEIFVHPRALRQRIATAGIDHAVVHSVDWTRQQNPQLYEFALAAMPVRERLIADDARRSIRRLTYARSAVQAAGLPVDVARAGLGIGAEALKTTLNRGATMKARGRGRPGGRTILVIWPSPGGDFGGSITHITGILGGFRRQGFRIGLLTPSPPPEAVRAVIDELEVIDAPKAAMRLTGDTVMIDANRRLALAGLDFAQKLGPSFIYQRHSPFMVAGAKLSRACGIPLVLEWNGSEVWVRNNWQVNLPVERVLDPLMIAAERTVVADAHLVAAVSAEAAAMALNAGASPESVLVLPNAVDIEYVDATLGNAPPAHGLAGPLLGWAGSFGPWHGAEMAVRALALLPNEVRLVMVGDGGQRGACEDLAAALRVADRIEFTGAISRPEAIRRLAGCDLLLSPHVPLPDTPFFGSPTKLFEYMALGRPIVASRLAQIGEVLEDGVTARLVTPGVLEELVDAIREVLDSEDQGRALGNAARRDAESNHTWENRARSVLELLDGVRA